VAERPPADLAQQVDAALREDIGSGDVTATLVPAGQSVRGSVITREEAVLCGRAWAEETFRRLDPHVRLTWHAADGERLLANQVIFEIAGPASGPTLRVNPVSGMIPGIMGKLFDFPALEAAPPASTSDR